ncbi:hypothetical protein [Candidatus Manganitrophus noduliformans]|uniref:hypothetical protein n=1 Tax=Candidatus Manganitrophus noduliformans TaxID=2606439 RepID=UPI00192E220E|nr:hypothetical protein [Candidatus Manganitrophus noduliformans]
MKKDTQLEKVKADSQQPTCGIIMPISNLDGCSEVHWSDVLSILSDAIDLAGFSPNLVSHADDVGIIQKRIIQNLYENPVVVCDVSGKNPNVMFELGMRLAFDKPTIIVKDDKTSYAFDTAPIEHLEYPRDLRFTKIVEFKEELVEKIKGTYQKSTSDENYTTFLKHFGTFKIPKIETEVISKEDYVLEEIKSLRNLILRATDQGIVSPKALLRSKLMLCMRETSKEVSKKVLDEVSLIEGVKVLNGPQRVRPSEAHFHIVFDPEFFFDREKVLAIAKNSTANVRWLDRN